MSNRKFAKAMQNLAREVRRFYRQFNRAAVNWLLRSAFVAHRRGQSPVAGFILPTTVLLLLVLTLTVGAMTLRAFDRNQQVIANAQEKVIYNAATPAIDRARSKLEFLFDPSKDARYPGGTPFESFLVGMLTNDGTTNGVARFTVKDSGGADVDPYTLPDEQRIDVGSPTNSTLDGNPDIAWRYRSDTNGDGTPDATVIYSIIFKTPVAQGGQTPPERLLTMTEQQKADAGLVRNGPISSQSRLTGCGNSSGAGDSGFTQEAWFEDVGNTSVIRKNFQVNTIVVPDNPKAATTTMEFQQDRQILRGNKWGAWFRYDLEIFPGPQFNWNGAMHTEGNMLLGNRNFNAYLVSAPASCLYQPESSELSITNRTPPSGNDPDEPDLGDFQGMVAAGLVGKPDFRRGTAQIHVQTNDTAPPTVRTLNEGNDSATENSAVGNLASDPVEIVLEEKTKSVNAADDSNRTFNGWTTKLDSVMRDRFNNSSQRVPFVDDLYRADDRWGPKPKYDDNAGGRIPAGTNVGETIPAGNRLISTPPALGNASVAIGLDGYWERRARTEGLRVLVGERLELGNIGGWVAPRDVDRNGRIEPPSGFDTSNPPIFVGDKDAATPGDLTELDGDPLYPPTVTPYPFRQGTTLPHLTQQRRSLRDNIPAVQSAAIYHAAVGNKDYPVACVAMTVHPGTHNTLRQSINFFPTNFKDNDSDTNTALLSDFFTGRGTDGWEYAPPGGSESQFIAEIAPGRPLRIALENLANFAGDPDGAFPPAQNNVIHPYPSMSMWGNQSNLRRALNRLNTLGYTGLSVADKTYIHTAACSLGMLATNIDQVQRFDPTNVRNDFRWNNSTEVMSDLSDRMTRLMDGIVDNGEVLPKARLNTYNYDPDENNADARLYNPADYYEVPPESFIAGLKQQTIQSGGDYLNDPVIRMAELIMNSHQIRRDRTFGFRPSPAFGEYGVAFNVNSVNPVKIFPSACDPDLFALGDNGSARATRLRANTDGGRRLENRNNTPIDTINSTTSWQFKPFGASYADEAAFPGAIGGDLSSVSGRRLVLSRLCGAIRVPRGYTPGKANVVNSNDPALRPVVLPKYPSLYYIFPEVEHGLRGEFATDTNSDGIANQPDEFDHRQPGAISANGGNQVTINNANDAATAAAGLNPFDREPYITDNYINSITTGNNVFQPVVATASNNPRLAAYPTPTAANGYLNSTDLSSLLTLPLPDFFSRVPYADSSPFPTPDLSVASLALTPHQLDGFPAGVPASVLPNYAPRDFQNDTSPNRIMIPTNPNPASTSVSSLSNLPTKPWAVPFLDWSMFDGRQLQVARVTDIDWGMLRSTKPAGQTPGNTEFSTGTTEEPWLPMSGIVYAFREDAVREDGIARPIGNSPINNIGVTNNQLIQGTAMNVSNPEQPSDPALQDKGISVKPIDHLPDPDRRVHGFRMRNGTQLKRNPSVIAPIQEADNVRGLSFFTDQPVYMMGNFNLHQEGTGNENTVGTLLEEFNETLFPNNVNNLNTGGSYNFSRFYNDRRNKNNNFATNSQDRWRPTEILADAVSILSNDFCDGSIADAFLSPASSSNAIPDFRVNTSNGQPSYPNSITRGIYNRDGLYSVACGNGDGFTSYQNQNRVKDLPSRRSEGWGWKREGASFVSPNGTTGSQPTWSDFTTPIQVGRTGEPLMIARPKDQNPTLPVNYGIGGLNLRYATPDENRGNGTRQVEDADNTMMSAIVVSGLSPSRVQQSYGGLHNFPRFIELWGGKRFFFSGSFLQLNFSNYATGPFEQEAWEPGQSPSNAEPIPHYSPPARLWGYDVALQFAPAGPAAARFVAPSATRSEFYTEPPVSDPYINKLCVAAQNAGLQTACVARQ